MSRFVKDLPVRFWTGIGYAGPGVVGGCGAVFEFVAEEIFEKRNHARVAGVGIEALDESLEHGAKVSGGVGPLLVGDEFVGGAVNVEAAVEVMQALGVVLVPEDGPLPRGRGKS